MIFLSSGAFETIDFDKSRLFFVWQACNSTLSFPRKRESRNTLDTPLSSTGQAYRVRHDRVGAANAEFIEEMVS